MIQDPVRAAIVEYKRHPSILKIKKQIRIENYFDFKHIYEKKNGRGTQRFKCKKS